jgi:hypothetical protein
VNRAFPHLLALLIAGGVLVTGCSTAQPPDRAASRCEEVSRQVQAQTDKARATEAQVRALLSSNEVSGAPGDPIFLAEWKGGSDPERFQALQRQGRSEIRVAFRIIVNNPKCYSASDVASAQEILSRPQGWD